MKYHRTILLKDGREVQIRSGTAEDGPAVFENFNKTHAQTDYLLSYPDENSYGPEEEAKFLAEKAADPREAEFVAVVGGEIAGTAGIEEVGKKHKVRHRAVFGISVLKEYWGLGIGRALAQACIECAREAGYGQLELDAVSDNERALALYRSLGFREYGRNPKGFRPRGGGYQELVLMRLELQ